MLAIGTGNRYFKKATLIHRGSTMKAQSSRRDFLKQTGLLAAAAGLGSPQTYSAQVPVPGLASPLNKLGLASYTTRNFSLDQTIQMTQRLGLKYLSIKDVHLPLTASDSDIQASIEKITKAGITPYACGVVYMKNAEQVDRAFEYAKAAGFKIIVGVPNHDLLERVSQKVAQYDIRVAIHNHGPTDKVYPTPQSAYEKIKDLDKRIGLCIDVGHTLRSGIDPAEDIVRFADRLLDVHLKDVTAASEEGTTVEIGRGAANMPAIVKALLAIGYSGVAGFEYEKDAKDPLPGTAESIGYVRGVLAALQK